MNIDDMICQSILSVNNSELRKRLANSILIVGGGGKFKGTIDYLEDKLFEKLTLLDNEIERVEIINYPNVDMKTITWIGGTIIPKLESSKDMWIMRERWCCDLDIKENDNNLNKDPLNDLSNFDNENKMNQIPNDGINIDENNLNLENKVNSNSVCNGNIMNTITNDDHLSGFKQESVKEKEKEKEKNKKRERPLDGGPKLIREKCPFKW